GSGGLGGFGGRSGRGGRGGGWDKLHGDRGRAVGRDVEGALTGGEAGPGHRDLVVAGSDSSDVEGAGIVGLGGRRRIDQRTQRRIAPRENDVGASDGQAAGHSRKKSTQKRQGAAARTRAA